MSREKLQIATIKFETIDRLLLLCNYSEQGKWLKIACSEHLSEILRARLNDLTLKFEHIEKITINNAEVFNMPKLPLPRLGDMRIIAICKPKPEFLRRKFPVITIQI
jgi:hypothetical protein